MMLMAHTFKYAAAAALGTNFKLFLSMDMTSLPCDSQGDAASLRNMITRYTGHPNQLIYRGRPFLSTFSGENCFFGMDNANAGWQSVVRNGISVCMILRTYNH
jgi:glucan endo-1,3-alpha-glucosidase